MPLTSERNTSMNKQEYHRPIACLVSAESNDFRRSSVSIHMALWDYSSFSLDPLFDNIITTNS
ncbi:MAG: hypothetical protein RPT00_04265, partial [Gammaproteobacteria bacterium]